VRPDGRLRAHDGSAEICAVTGVVRHRTGRTYGVGDWVRAGASIGLSYAEAGLLVEAADGCSSSALAETLRRRLLLATRIGLCRPFAPGDGASSFPVGSRPFPVGPRRCAARPGQMTTRTAFPSHSGRHSGRAPLGDSARRRYATASSGARGEGRLAS
jgi:hypothetical protein